MKRIGNPILFMFINFFPSEALDPYNKQLGLGQEFIVSHHIEESHVGS